MVHHSIYYDLHYKNSVREFPRDLSMSVWYVRPTRCIEHMFLENVQVQVGREVIKKLNIGKTLPPG